MERSLASARGIASSTKKTFIIIGMLVQDWLKDINTAGVRHMEEIFDAKILRTFKNRYFCIENMRNFLIADGTKVGSVKRFHTKKAGALDDKCTANCINHPFLEVIKMVIFQVESI